MILGKEKMKFAEQIFDLRCDGTHGWIPYRNGWLTFESFGHNEDENEDWTETSYVKNIDYLGYPMPPVIDCFIVYDGEFENTGK